MIFYFVIGCVLNTLLGSIYGVLVFLKSPLKKTNILCLGMAISIATWSLGFCLLVIAKEIHVARFYLKYLHYLGAIFIAPFLLHFVLVLLNKERQHRSVIIINYAVVIFLQIANIADHLVSLSVKPPFNFYTTPGTFYYLFAGMFALDVIYAHYLLYIEYKNSKGNRREQIKYLFAGLLVSFTGGATSFPLVFDIQFFPFGVPLGWVYVVAAAYSIIKYQFMDIRLVINKVVVFTCVYLPILLVPFILVYWKKSFFVHVFGEHFWILPTFSEGILAIIGLFVYRIIQGKTERRLLQEDYQHRRAIEDLSKDLVRFDDIKKLAQLVVSRCREKGGIESAGIYIWQERTSSYLLVYQEGLVDTGLEKELKANNLLIALLKQKQDYVGYEEISEGTKKSAIRSYPWSIAIPAFHRHDLLGILFLGDKKNSQIYTSVEFWAFKLLASQIATTIIAIKTFEEKSRLEREFTEVQRMIEIGRLACGMGHQINNNLGIVCSASQMLQLDMEIRELLGKKPEVLGRYDETVAEMISQARDCRRIIEEVSLYGKSEPAAKEDADVDLCEVFGRSLRFAQLRNPRFKHMDLEIELPQTPAIVWGSKLQLQQVMINVLNNSFDAIVMEEDACKDPSYKGWMKVVLSEGHDSYHMHFMDNGIGMTERTKESVFKVPMYTTKSSAEKRQTREEEEGKKSEITGGTGIGTYMVRMMVRGHGGDIQVCHSEYHKGTDILLVLPKKKERVS